MYVLVYKIFRYGTFRIFDSVNIETLNTCNRKCSFCPVTYYPKERVEMSRKLFSKIVDELALINFCGRISLHSYNEPLLDGRIVDLIREVRIKCRQSFIVIYTNGDFVTPVLFRKMTEAGLDLLHVTQYDQKLNTNVLKLLENKATRRNKNITVKSFDEGQICNRAGLLPSIRSKCLINTHCFLPERQIVISARGNILLCCNDYLERGVMGNCDKKNLMDIWNNEKFKQIRKHLKAGKRQVNDLCKVCDYKEGSKLKTEQKVFNYRNIPLMRHYERLIFS
ncbi:SPASM domain-containing protein [Candidatus Parcubacteria bacterium]|nr:SPASM domain-containing protein [Candidatus Parcubacteria bacterium]